MSYQGLGNDYDSVQTVDDVAEYTDMMGAASMLNQRKRGVPWKDDATKSLIFLWLFVLLSYWLVGFFFRRYLV